MGKFHKADKDNKCKEYSMIATLLHVEAMLYQYEGKAAPISNGGEEIQEMRRAISGLLWVLHWCVSSDFMCLHWCLCFDFIGLIICLKDSKRLILGSNL